MPLYNFQKQLENDLKKSVKLTVNNNRSTMLSIKWEPNCTKVSLHQFFLKAPDSIMKDLAFYIKKKNGFIPSGIKLFIEENMRKLDYSHLIPKKNLDVAGKIYNLQEILDDINDEYFRRKLRLNITWFGKRVQNNRSQVTFGLYHEPMKLIKINRLLDSVKVPEYLVSYVIYHEMLHHVCPSYYDENGKHRIHSKEFKRKEEKFRYYDLAQGWIQENRQRLFSRKAFN